MTDNVKDKSEGLSLDERIKAIMAAYEAQMKLAKSTDKLITAVGKDEKIEARKIKASDIEQHKLAEIMAQKMDFPTHAPYLSIIPIPSLLVDKAEIDFQISITDNDAERKKSIRSRILCLRYHVDKF